MIMISISRVDKVDVILGDNGWRLTSMP